jgi:hypothetical protein
MSDDHSDFSARRPLKYGEFVALTNDQLAFPKKPRGAVPDGEHLSATEWLFMVVLSRWCYKGKPCTWNDLELADAMGLPGDEKSKKWQVRSIINGRWVRGVRWPGVCDPTRGFVLRTYTKGGRNGRQLFMTPKWQEFRRGRYRLVRAPLPDDASLDGQRMPEPAPAAGLPQGMPEPAPAAGLPQGIAEAAAIAEAHVLPAEAGRVLGDKIRAGAFRFRQPAELPGVIWMAADKGKSFGWIVRCDQNGINAVEAEEARGRVMKRMEDAGKAKVARQQAARQRASPPAPPTDDDIHHWREWAATPGHVLHRLGLSKLAEHGISVS